jgi:hypothetical protein
MKIEKYHNINILGRQAKEAGNFRSLSTAPIVAGCLLPLGNEA